MNEVKSAVPEQTKALAEYKHTERMLSCRFDPAGQHVFATAYDNTIQRWNLSTGKATPLVGHDSWVRALAFHPAGNQLYSAGYDGRLIVWETSAEAPTPLRTIDAHQGWVRALAVNKAGTRLASCGNDNLIRIWDTSDLSLLDTLAGHRNHVYSVAFHPDGARLVSGDLKGELREWDLASSEQLRTFDAAPLWKYDAGFGADIGGVRGLDISTDGKLLAAGGISEVTNAFAGLGEPLALVFDYESGAKKQSHPSSKKLKGPLWNVRFARAGFLIGASGGHDGGHLLFWKLDQSPEFFDFKLPDLCRDFDLHPDGLRLCTTHEDRTVRVWQMGA